MSAQPYVAPGYEAVAELFERERGSLGYGGGAYCAYVAGKPVVDIWGGSARPGQPWDADTTTVIMSATKALASLCVQLLVDRGEIDPESLVIDIWPEYGQNGKAKTRVRDILQHRAGMLGFPGQHEITHYDGTGWDAYDEVAAGYAAAPPSWEPGTRHGYHALSVGPLLSEIVRRVTGMSIGQMFAKEVAGPLGIDVHIGTPPEEIGHVARVYPVRTEHLPATLRKVHDAADATMRDANSMLGLAFLADGAGDHLFAHVEELSNNPAFLAIEHPSSNATANARGLAKLWALMANGGELDGLRLLSPQIVTAWSTIVTRDPDCTLADVPVPRIAASMATAPLPRTIGYLGNIGVPGIGNRFGPNPNSYGGEGAGGQQSWCDPDNNIAVGYVRSELALIDVLQPRLTNVLYRCAEQLGHPIRLARKNAVAAVAARAVGAYLRPRIAVPATPAQL